MIGDPFLAIATMASIPRVIGAPVIEGDALSGVSGTTIQVTGLSIGPNKLVLLPVWIYRSSEFASDVASWSGITFASGPTLIAGTRENIKQSDANRTPCVEIWQATTGSSGVSGDLTATISASATHKSMGVMSFSKPAPSPIVASASAEDDGAGAVTSLGLTLDPAGTPPTESYGLVVSLQSDFASANPTLSGWTSWPGMTAQVGTSYTANVWYKAAMAASETITGYAAAKAKVACAVAVT